MKKLFLASCTLNVVLLLLLVGCGYLYVSKKVIFTPKPVVAQNQQNFPVATAEVNTSWNLPLTKNTQEKPVHLTITTIKKTDRITSGKTSYTTKNGKAFLVVETIVKNTGKTSFSIGPSDYVQLVVNNQATPALYKALVQTVAPGATYQSSMVFLVDQKTNTFTISLGENVTSPILLPVKF